MKGGGRLCANPIQVNNTLFEKRFVPANHVCKAKLQIHCKVMGHYIVFSMK